MKAIQNAILIFTFTWSLGLSFLIMQFFGLIAFFQSFNVKKSKLFFLEFLLIALIVTKLISFIYAFTVIGNYKNFIDVINFFYIYSIWLFGFFIVFYISRANFFIDIIKKISNQSGYILGIIFISIIILNITNYNSELQFKSLFFGLLPDSIKNIPLINDSLTLKVLGRDWSSISSGVRLNLFFPYANALGIATLIFLVLKLTYQPKEKDIKRTFFWLFIAAIIIFYTFSRSAFLSYLIFVTLYISSWLIGNRRNLFMLVMLFLLSIPILYISIGFFDVISNIRSGSSNTRIFLYQQSIERVMNESIILGLSIREDFGFVKELGSHSLIVGIFYKNGLIGLFILLLFIIITCQPFFKRSF